MFVAKDKRFRLMKVNKMHSNSERGKEGKRINFKEKKFIQVELGFRYKNDGD